MLLFFKLYFLFPSGLRHACSVEGRQEGMEKWEGPCEGPKGAAPGCLLAPAGWGMGQKVGISPDFILPLVLYMILGKSLPLLLKVSD